MAVCGCYPLCIVILYSNKFIHFQKKKKKVHDVITLTLLSQYLCARLKKEKKGGLVTWKFVATG